MGPQGHLPRLLRHLCPTRPDLILHLLSLLRLLGTLPPKGPESRHQAIDIGPLTHPTGDFPLLETTSSETLRQAPDSVTSSICFNPPLLIPALVQGIYRPLVNIMGCKKKEVENWYIRKILWFPSFYRQKLVA